MDGRLGNNQSPGPTIPEEEVPSERDAVATDARNARQKVGKLEKKGSHVTHVHFLD